jgi:acetyltransferase-like isoleucine patch superfamily enzyme
MIDIEFSHPARDLETLYTFNQNSVLRVGRWSYIGKSELALYESTRLISIGSFCSIANGCQFILVTDHASDFISQYPLESLFESQTSRTIIEKAYQKSKSRLNPQVGIVIEHDVWIGRNVVLLPGTHLHSGSIVGAGSVIRGIVPPYSVVIGNPPKIIRFRFEHNIIQQLLTLKWWDWDDDKIREHSETLLAVGNEKSIITLSKIK